MPLARTTSFYEHRKGLFLTTIGAVLFTFDVPLIRLAAADKWTLIFARGGLLFLALTVLWIIVHRGLQLRRSFINGTAGVVVAISSTLANLMFLAAVHETTAANLVFLVALNPVFCVALAWLVLREKVAWQTWLAIAAALSGVAIIVWDGLTAGTVVGDLLALGVALCMAITLTTARKSGENVVTSLAIGALASALVGSFLAEPAALPAASWGWITVNAFLIVPIAMALLAMGPRFLPAPEVAMFFLVEVVLTPIWIWLIFEELPTPHSLFGGVIVFAALFIHSLWRLTSSQRTGEAQALPSAE